MKKNNERGLLSLEASISLTIFIFLMLFMYSFFVFFEARNQMGHTLLATAQSMSLDTYEKERLANSANVAQIIYGLYNLHGGDNSDFVTESEWHKDTKRLQSEIKERFIAYLADGDEDKADKMLKRYNIVDGIDGLDFSESKYESGKLKLVVQYTLEYEFQVFALDDLKMKQSVCSKTW